jgi:Spy/CpxP family protein refolding chaperone
MKNLFSARPGLLAAVLLASAVAVGFLGGVAADRLLFAPRTSYAAEQASDAPRDTLRPPGRRGPGGDRMMPGQHRPDGGRYLDVMARHLELTDEQRARIVEILAVQETRMQEITRDTRPRMRSVAEDTRASIEAVLTDEQRSRFQELRSRRDMHGGPGPWGGRGDGERRRPRVADTIL